MHTYLYDIVVHSIQTLDVVRQDVSHFSFLISEYNVRRYYEYLGMYENNNGTVGQAISWSCMRATETMIERRVSRPPTKSCTKLCNSRMSYMHCRRKHAQSVVRVSHSVILQNSTMLITIVEQRPIISDNLIYKNALPQADIINTIYCLIKTNYNLDVKQKLL